MSESKKHHLRFSLGTVMVLTVGIGLGLMLKDYVELYETHRETVNVKRTVAVTGAIQQPGHYEISQPVSVIDALSMAGGVNPTADTQRISVRRAKASGHAEVTIVDLQSARAGRVPADTIMLRDGDVVCVPPAQNPAGSESSKPHAFP